MKYAYGRMHDSLGNRMLVCGHVADDRMFCRVAGCAQSESAQLSTRFERMDGADIRAYAVGCRGCGYVVCACHQKGQRWVETQGLYGFSFTVIPPSGAIGGQFIRGMHRYGWDGDRFMRYVGAGEWERWSLLGCGCPTPDEGETLCEHSTQAPLIEKPSAVHLIIAALHGLACTRFTVSEEKGYSGFVVRLDPYSGKQWTIPAERWESYPRIAAREAGDWINCERRRLEARKALKDD